MTNQATTPLRPVPSDTGVVPYQLPERSEKAAAYLASTSPSFWARIGQHLDPAAFTDPSAALILRACKAHADKAGKGPAGASIPLTRLSVWRDAGKITPAQVDACSDLYDSVEEVGLGEVDGLVEELRYIIRRREEKSLIQDILKQYGTHGDLSKLVDRLARVQRIGLVDLDIGVRLTGEVFDDIDRLRHVDRLSTGISDLDFQLEGGLRCSCLGVIMADEKVGKSLMLAYLAASALLHGLNVAFATNELDEMTITARILSIITNVPTSDILKGQWQEAKDRLEHLQQDHKFGSLIVKKFEPFAATADDKKEWLEHCESNGFDWDVLIIDYADRMCGSSKDLHSYDAMREVYDGIRSLGTTKKRWVWTASQTKGGNEKGMARLSDSRHKGRILDLCLELTQEEEDGSMMSIKCVGNRHGPAGFTVGPFPTDFHYGRISCDISDLLRRNWGI